MLCQFPHPHSLTSWSWYWRSIVSSKSNELFLALFRFYHPRWHFSLTFVFPLVSMNSFFGVPSLPLIKTLVYFAWIIFHWCYFLSLPATLGDVQSARFCLRFSSNTVSIKNSFTCMDLPHCHSKPNCEPSSASLLGFRLLCPVDCGPSLLKTQQHLFTFNTQNQIIIPYQRYFPFLLYPLDIR